MIKRILLFLFLFFTLLIFNTRAFSQIPIKKFYQSTFHLDSLLNKQMSDSGFSFEFNRWVQVADMNNDGKLDIF